MIPTLRIMTRKSKIGFTKQWKTKTVQEMLDLYKSKILIGYYYKYTNVNYIEDILKELGLTKEWRIPKPGSDLKKYAEFRKAKNWQFRSSSGADKLKTKRTPKSLTKRALQAKNHGR